MLLHSSSDAVASRSVRVADDPEDFAGLARVLHGYLLRTGVAATAVSAVEASRVLDAGFYSSELLVEDGGALGVKLVGEPRTRVVRWLARGDGSTPCEVQIAGLQHYFQ
jgi:hypothetical protein